MAPSSEDDTELLVDTGERCLPWMGDTQVIYEHLHRYYFAQAIVANQRVLDLGCGEGYGSAILAETAGNVVGVDIDPAAIGHARATYSRNNLHFEVASIEALDAYPDNTFDVIVCFEVLEHVANHEDVIVAVRRILRAGGLLLVSTPDRERYNAWRSPNPFHVRELSIDELRDLVAAVFEHQIIWTQHLTVGSALTAVDSEISGTHTVIVTRQGGRWTTTTREDDYLLAVASDRPLHDMPGLSILVDRESSIIEERVHAALRKAIEPASDRTRDRGDSRATPVTGSAQHRLLARARRFSLLRRLRS